MSSKKFLLDWGSVITWTECNSLCTCLLWKLQASTYMVPSPTQSDSSMVFQKWDKPVQVFFFFSFVFCLPSCSTELSWLSAQQGQKRSFPKSSKSKAWILNCQKCIFPLSEMKWVLQVSVFISPDKEPVKRAFLIARFQEDQTKYQPSQIRMCIYMCVYIYIKKRPTPTSQQLDEISAVHTAVCQFGVITCWKNWKNLCAGKNIFICIKSVLKRIPVIRWLLIRLKFQITTSGCLRPTSGLVFCPCHFWMASGALVPGPLKMVRRISGLKQSPRQESVAVIKLKIKPL